MLTKINQNRMRKTLLSVYRNYYSTESRVDATVAII